MRVAAVLACLLAGCSAQQYASAPAETSAGAAVTATAAPPAAGGESLPEAMPSPEQQIVFDEHAALTQLAAEVEVMARTQDCGSACEGGERLCALSERICEIADRHPSDVEIGGRCADGRERCRIARERLAAACGCATD